MHSTKFQSVHPDKSNNLKITKKNVKCLTVHK